VLGTGLSPATGRENYIGIELPVDGVTEAEKKKV
jgi:hypothetical protein